MQKGKDCIGLAVICENTGKILGKITDVICTSTLHSIEFLQVADKNSNELRLCIPSWISSIGRDAALVTLADLPSFQIKKDGILLSKLKGTHVVCSDGTGLGEVVDILFELPLCNIKGLEVSEGFIGDLLTGRLCIYKEAIKTISQDCILVDFWKKGLELSCPLCGSNEVGKIGQDQFYCWNCFVEYDSKNQVYTVEEDGSLIAYGTSRPMKTGG